MPGSVKFISLSAFAHDEDGQVRPSRPATTIQQNDQTPIYESQVIEADSEDMEETGCIIKGAVAPPRRSRNNYQQNGKHLLTESDARNGNVDDGLTLYTD